MAAPDSRELDESAVTRVLAGDASAFEPIMRRHNQRLFRLTRAILGDDAEAEDATQQTYLSAFTHLATFQGDASFATWLTRIARNEALTRLRKRKRLAETPIESDEVPMPGTRPRSPEEGAALAQLTGVIERAIDALPERYRVVFVMREVEGLGTQETAECLEVTEEVVKVRLHRARRQLREALLDDIDAQTPEAFVFLGERCERITRAVLDALTHKAGTPP